MPKTKISEFSATPGNNTDIDGINISEGCAPSGINDAIRELMSQLKDFQAGTAGDSFNGPVGTTTAAAGAFTTLSASGAVTLSGGTANGVPYLNGSKVLTTGSALTFDGTNFSVGGGSNSSRFNVTNGSSGGFEVNPDGTNSGPTLIAYNRTGAAYLQLTSLALNHVWQNSGTETMRLTSTGLGIGTSSPAVKTNIVGSAGVTLRIEENSSGNNTRGDFSANSTNVAVGAKSNSPLLFTTNDTERMRLDSSGNLGLGVTPSAWAGSGPALQIGSYASVFNNSSLGSSEVAYNTIRSGSDAYVYNITGIAASRFQQRDGAFRFFTAPSGTAGNAISFTQAMTLDASGNLLVGTTTAIGKLTVYKAGTSYADSLVLSNDSAYGANQGIAWGSSTNISGRIKGVDDGAYGTHLTFETRTGGPSTSTTERARIDSSGNLLVGTTSGTGARLYVVGDSTATYVQSIYDSRTDNNPGGGMIGFQRRVGTGSPSFVGGITTSTTSTAYNTSSDYRLKENIQPMTGALAKVAALKPCTYNWKADGSDGEGFIAHELAEVVPQCVTGEKDAVDADGNPQYQGIDTSFLVATLTAAIQELKAEFDAYKATHP